MSGVLNPLLKQHVVEFIRGVGVITDGVTDASDTASPWSWVVPSGVSRLIVDGTAGGGPGGGGGVGAGNISTGGGAGGPCGNQVLGAEVSVAPGSTLTVTVGAGGVGPAIGGVGTAGETTSIDGILAGPQGAIFAIENDVASRGNDGGESAATFIFGGTSNEPVWNNNVTGGAVSAANGNTAPTPSSATFMGLMSGSAMGGVSLIRPGGGGGAGASSGAVAGGNGGSSGTTAQMKSLFSTSVSGGTGNTTGTLSRGGGGAGGCGLFGPGGAGGNGGAAGSAPASGYGGGGGGGGGDGAGGNGAPGYLRLTYWSA